VFLDDIVLYARSLAEHTTKLREVFDRIRENRLKLKPEKCELLRKEVSYLGHVISENGVLPERNKTKAVEEFPTPEREAAKGFFRFNELLPAVRGEF
jgi:hypothetical protein